MLREWLRVFRAQTGAATVLLLLVPFLYDAEPNVLAILAVAGFALFVHYGSFGHNSLMDFVTGYDKRDPAKLHHPLNTGAITAGQAHLVIHWMLVAAAVIGIALTVWLSPAPVYALIFLIGWICLGFAYNNGLSKESRTGCFAITGCMVSVAGFAWFLSHDTMTQVGALFLVYTYFAIMYQIAWSGFIKEIMEYEPSNVLHWMGSRIRHYGDHPILELGPAAHFGAYIKFAGMVAGVLLICTVSNGPAMYVGLALVLLALFLLSGVLVDREYNRPRELQQMSKMEIVTIFAPVVPLLGLVTGLALLAVCLAYFVVVNALLWGAWYPKV